MIKQIHHISSVMCICVIYWCIFGRKTRESSYHINSAQFVWIVFLVCFRLLYYFGFVSISKWTHWREHKRFLPHTNAIHFIWVNFRRKDDQLTIRRKNSCEWEKKKKTFSKWFIGPHLALSCSHNKYLQRFRTHKYFSCCYFGHKFICYFLFGRFYRPKRCYAFRKCPNEREKKFHKNRYVQAFTFVQMSNNAIFSHSMIIYGDLYASSSWLLKIIPEQIYTNRFWRFSCRRSVSHYIVHFTLSLAKQHTNQSVWCCLWTSTNSRHHCVQINME